MIIEVCADFWHRVQDGNPPDPVTYADAVQRFGKSAAAGAVVASETDIPVVDGLRAVRDEIKRLEALQDDLRGRIIIALGESGDMLVGPDGAALVTYKFGNGRRTFDVKAFEKDHPHLHQEYLKTGEPQRRFLLK